MNVLFNHVGYAPEAKKRLLMEAPEATAWTAVDLVELSTGRPVWSGQPEFVGAVAGWSVGPWWELDVTAVHTPGRYAVRWQCADGVSGQSEGFDIQPDLQGPAMISDLLFHIKSQRSSGVWDRADAKAPRLDDREPRDVSGGWFGRVGVGAVVATLHRERAVRLLRRTVTR